MGTSLSLLNYGVAGAIIFVVALFLAFLRDERRARAKERKDERETWEEERKAEREDREKARCEFVKALNHNTASLHDLALQCQRAQSAQRREA